jgi:hypothetical protein
MGTGQRAYYERQKKNREFVKICSRSVHDVQQNKNDFRG